MAMNNLATLLWKKGDLAGAKERLTTVVAQRTQTLGADHPHTKTATENLAKVEQALKQQRKPRR